MLTFSTLYFLPFYRDPYGGYPNGILAFGWTVFAILITVSMATIWKRDPTELPPLETLKEQLTKEIENDETRHVEEVDSDDKDDVDIEAVTE